MNGAGSDSRASPTSCVCARDGQLAVGEAQPQRRVALRHQRDAADDVEQLLARQLAARARTAPAAAGGSSGTGRRCGASSATRRRRRRRRGSRARRAGSRPPTAAIRASSWSARAGMIASSSGSVPRRGVSLTASRYESVAAMTSLPGLEADEDAGQHRAALVARGRAADARRSSRGARRGRPACSASRLDVGQPGEVLGRVGVQPVGRRAATITTTRTPRCRCSSETSPSGSARAMSSSRRPGTTTSPSPTTCASSDARSETSMSVAASSSRPPLGAQLDAAEDEHGGPRRDATGDELSVAGQVVLGDGSPQPGPTMVSESIIY